MTPKAKDQRSAGELELEEDTCTRKKKSRRVSFAETTVHVFKRDDESESPANSTPVRSEGCGLSDNEGTVGFGGTQSQGDDSVESAPDDEGEDRARLRFVRDIDSSSPGSAVGSVTSNEDDNFFGPVSTSFINSGHLSESGMPDDNNHDITLDSTAFSLHFRSIAPPDDQSANSAGSLRTPTVDTTPTMPLNFLVGRDRTEELPSKCSGQMSNSLKFGGSHSNDYTKLSRTLEALMNEVNLRMQHNSPIGGCRFTTSSCQTDDVGIRKPSKYGEVVGIQNSCYDEPRHSIHCSVSPMESISNESLLHAKTKTLSSHSNSEKIKEMFSPIPAYIFGKGHEAVHAEVAFSNGQNSKLLSPLHGELQNDNGQAFDVHQELFRCTTSEGKSFPNSSLHNISAVLSILDGVEQKLEPVSVAHTPKNATNSIQSPALQEIMPISGKENLIFHMKTPDTAVKAFQFSSLKGSTSPSKVKQTQPLDFSVLFQGELMHDAARQQSDYLRTELMEHGERISAIKNNVSRPDVKSSMQSDYENAALESVDISMETPDNAVKVFQFSTLKGSISSYQDKQRQLQYRPVLSQSELLHNPAKELSASLKMELRDHGERISAIKTSITRSRSKSKLPTDCEAAPQMKDVFITNLQGCLNESYDDPYMKHAGISDGNINANKIAAAKQLENLDSVKDLNCSRNGSYLTGLDKSAAFMETVEKGQSEKCVEFCYDSSLKLPLALDLCTSFIDQREADLKESYRDISSKYALANKEKSALSSKGCFTPGVDESSSRELLERKSLQPSTSPASPVEKVSNSEKLKVCVRSGTSVHYGKAGIDSKTFGVGCLDYNQNLNDNSANRPKKVTEKPVIDPYKEPREVLETNTTLSTSFESSAEKIVLSSNSHFLNKMNLVSPKKFQVAISNFDGSRHQNSETQQETYYGPDVAVVGDTGNRQTCHTENAAYSESSRMKNGPVILPDVIGDSVILSVDHMHHDEALDIAGKAPPKSWTDVFSKLFDTTHNLLPQSISELNLQKLDDMENLLDELQTARKYEGLCNTLRNKKSCGNPHQKRVIDARSLLEKLGIAKARKQLKCMKLKKIHNKAQILQSQVEEYDKLKSTYVQLLHLCSRFAESHESSFCKYQVLDMKLEEQNRLMTMKQEFGILEQNIKLLLNSFESSCKLTGKMSCNDVIREVHEYVMRRVFCKEIQQHVRLWKLCDVVMENDHYEIMLGYCNLLFQRFTINKSRFSSMVSNILSNAANIIKKYPNMNACIAFEFIFKLNVDQKFANSNCIYERTVETNLLMGTLIDVLDEILLSRLELLNLIFTTFLKQSSGELELELCFYSSSSGRKLILGIDMTCLNCGIYPSELKIRVREQQTTLPSSIVNKAIGAAQSLECGHLMILRFCRCASQIIQCSA